MDKGVMKNIKGFFRHRKNKNNLSYFQEQAGYTT